MAGGYLNWIVVEECVHHSQSENDVCKGFPQKTVVPSRKINKSRWTGRRV